MTKNYDSEIVDIVLDTLEEKLKTTGRHLIKTDTVFDYCSDRIDLTDEDPTRERLLEKGMRQTMQTRLYGRNYFSVATGYFVNVDTCENIWYLKMIINRKDDTILDKTVVRNKLAELKGLNGDLRMVWDGVDYAGVEETKTWDEIIEDLEADAI